MISIIIPVYNRASEIRSLLESFCFQTYKRFEIVVVDDGSTDDLSKVVESFKNKIRIQYIFQANKGPASARNLGMKQASGDWYVFIDSDCTVPKDYVKNLWENINLNDFDAFGGPDTYKEDFSDLLKAINFSMTSFIGTGGARGTTGKKISKYYPRSFNMGIRKIVFSDISGMIDLRHGQDLEFSNRIYKAGYRVKYLPDVFVYHKRRTSLLKFFKQIFNWGVARVNLGNIDKELLKPVHFFPAIVIFIMLLSICISLLYQIDLILKLFFIFILLFELVAFVQSSIQYKSIKVGLLSMITLISQIIAYGMGFIYASVNIWGFKRKDIKGFSKND